MKTEFIPYEQALVLKELGFNEPCLGYYTIYSDGEVKLFTSDKGFRNLEAPTYSQAFRFFREKYKYLASPFSTESEEGKVIYYFEIGKVDKFTVDIYSDDKSTYEEAELACIVKLIEIVKNNE
jgi:hypothetical protein